jgi:putative membrane protein
MSKQGDEHDPRVVFAAERTLLAWVRTGLALMGFGFVIARFGLYLRELAVVQGAEPSRHTVFSEYIGVMLVLVGVVVNVVSAIQHFGFITRYNRGEVTRTSPLSGGVILSFLLAVLGLGLAGYLMWLG